MTESPDDIVGHKTFDTGECDPETGFPMLRHEPLTRFEGESLWNEVKRRDAERIDRIPDEKSAIKAMFDAWLRLKEFGWNDIMYCPKDGTKFRVIENGSTGIFDCIYEGEWPDGHWTMFDGRDSYPSSIAPPLYRLYPEDEIKHKQRMAEAAARWRMKNERP